jgi:hypothetical protein
MCAVYDGIVAKAFLPSITKDTNTAAWTASDFIAEIHTRQSRNSRHTHNSNPWNQWTLGFDQRICVIIYIMWFRWTQELPTGNRWAPCITEICLSFLYLYWLLQLPVIIDDRLAQNPFKIIPMAKLDICSGLLLHWNLPLFTLFQKLWAIKSNTCWNCHLFWSCDSRCLCLCDKIGNVQCLIFLII